MKKLFSLFAAILFAGSMMAEDVTGTINFGNASGSTAINSTSVTGNDSQGVKWTITTTFSGETSFTQNAAYSQVGSAKKPASSITFTATLPEAQTIKAFSAKFGGFNSTAGTVTLKVGETTVGSGSLNATADVIVEATNTTTKGDVLTVTVTGIDKGVKVYYISYTYEAEAPAVAKPSILGETPFFGETEVTLDCKTEGAKIYYTLNGSEPSATSTEYTAAFKLNATTTVKAIAILGEDKSAVASKEFVLNPTFDSFEALIAAGLASGTEVQVSFEDLVITKFGGSSKGVYFVIKEVEYEIFTYDATVPATWLVGGSISGTIRGEWKLYNSTWELVPSASDWKWTDLTYKAPAVPAVIITTTSIDAPAAGKSGKIEVTYNYIEDLASVEVAFFEEDGTTPATCDWVNTSFDSEKNVEYTIAANEGEARTAYLKVVAGEVASALVTISQAKYVSPYAVLPFAFDGGRNAVESTAGLTQDGLGTDYSSSPKLKFDSSNDYLILQINEDAGKLTFDIKGNSFSGSTFTVQTSENGEAYTDLKAYTELGGTQSEEFDIAKGVRFIKWIYTEKVNGNVALGNIKLEKPTATALDNTDAEVKAEKFFRNGQLIIRKNGVEYNALGAQL